MLPTEEINQLRTQFYNGVVVDVESVHPDLRIFRLRPDAGPLPYEPGQYATLALGSWEPRAPGTQAEPDGENDHPHLIKRAYSISSPLLDRNPLEGAPLVAPRNAKELEFYIALVRQAAHPPALTPRLFMLATGDRIWIAPQAHGVYSVGPYRRDDRLVFIATGTGEAPHNAMIAHLLASGHSGEIVNIVCVRWLRDLGYAAKHRRLEQMFDNYRYLALSTREPQNVDSSRADFIGKQYVQGFVESGGFERATGRPLTPDATHVYLCGNPAMIGLPTHPGRLPHEYPSPPGMVEILERRGFQLDLPHRPGNIRCERYW